MSKEIQPDNLYQSEEEENPPLGEQGQSTQVPIQEPQGGPGGAQHPVLIQRPATPHPHGPGAGQEGPDNPKPDNELEELRGFFAAAKRQRELDRLKALRARFEAGNIAALLEADSEPRIATVVPSAPTMSLPRPEKPQQYTKRNQMECNRWMRNCEVYYNRSPGYFPVEALKIDFATSYISEPLKTLWEAHCIEAQVLDFTLALHDYIKKDLLMLSPERRNTIPLVEENAMIIYCRKGPVKEPREFQPKNNTNKLSPNSSKPEGVKRTPKRPRLATLGYSGGNPAKKAKPQGGSADVSCWNCGEPGHTKPNCPKLHRADKDFKKSNDSQEGKGKGRQS
ncbi:hypothetical protein EJ02DRAFT_460569 [Clathrospora elynae]|uniref:CCHC-type domain-containing protein n=1 Tax=Clathrospora elynae TaxID=706981 RepID=A0A6A5S6J7_9PLEO|nr:hypothetical protein EJ02DRAFT_460569 [Clathrospora elynae]